MLNFDISAASRVGCVRDNNEDMILVKDTFVRNDALRMQIDIKPEERYMIALADGMGGHQSGEVASSDVLHNLHFFFSDIPSVLSPGQFNEAIYGWLQSVNNIIDSKGHVDPQYRGMGTTLVSFAYYNHEFYTMNCGDSRLYRFHDNKLKQITTDHSLSNMLGSSEHSSIITNCIGGGCKSSYVDLVQCTEDVLPGDVFLLCSDGLTDMISDEKIEEMVREGLDAEAFCTAAEEAGGFDNVSVAVVTVSCSK